MTKLNVFTLVLCIITSPILGMQPKKEVKETKKSWIQRHPVLAFAGATLIGFSLFTQEKCVCSPDSMVIGGGQRSRECVKDGDYCYWQPIRFNNNDLVPKDLPGKFNHLGEYELDGYERVDVEEASRRHRDAII